MRSRSTAKLVRVGDGSSAFARFAVALFVAYAASSRCSSSSVRSRIRSEATLFARLSFASRSIPVAMGISLIGRAYAAPRVASIAGDAGAVHREPRRVGLRFAHPLEQVALSIAHRAQRAGRTHARRV